MGRATMNKHYFNKLSKEFNLYAEKTTWSKPKLIKIEHTGFFKRHVGMRGLNYNESSLLDFGTRIIEAKNVHFAYNSKFKTITLYIDSTVHSVNAGTYIEYVKDGKTVCSTVYDSEEKRHYLWEKLGFTSEELDLYQLYNQEEFKAKLAEKGCKLLVFFRFNAGIYLNLPHFFTNPSIPIDGKNSYVKPTRHGIEFGFISSGTYNSLPNVIKISRVQNIQTVTLHSLGIERKGYYSHDLKCSISKTQAKKAKRFFAKRFKAA
jgi:hypothetical protein